MSKQSSRKSIQVKQELSAATSLKVVTEVTEEAIRARAYEIYLARGGVAGDPILDWLQAEQELRSRSKAR